METIRYEQSAPLPGKLMSNVEPAAAVFILEMSKAFPLPPAGGLIWELTKDHCERLEGMAACHGAFNKYSELARAIRRLGSVKVWVDAENPNPHPPALDKNEPPA